MSANIYMSSMLNEYGTWYGWTFWGEHDVASQITYSLLEQAVREIYGFDHPARNVADQRIWVNDPNEELRYQSWLVEPVGLVEKMIGHVQRNEDEYAVGTLTAYNELHRRLVARLGAGKQEIVDDLARGVMFEVENSDGYMRAGQEDSYYYTFLVVEDGEIFENSRTPHVEDLADRLLRHAAQTNSLVKRVSITQS